MARPRLPLVPRFMKFVQVDPVTGCWIWTSTISKKGYGRFWNDGSQHHAHTMAYELFKGTIPEGMQPDHTCHTNDKACPGGITCPHRRCCCPDHLELVTRKENINRGRNRNTKKTHCSKGHPYSEENTWYYTAKGRNWRHCKECNRIASRRNRAAKMARRDQPKPTSMPDSEHP